MKRRCVAIDFDEVLIYGLEGYLTHYNLKYGTTFTSGDFHTSHWWEVMGCTEVESFERYVNYHTCGDGYNAKPVEKAYEALCRIRSEYAESLVVITHRLVDFEAETRYLLDQYYPRLFDEVYFGSVRGAPSRQKAEMCHEVGAEMIVDDHPLTICRCAEAGVQAFLFGHGKYPWSKVEGDFPRGVTPVRSWSDVLRELGRSAVVAR